MTVNTTSLATGVTRTLTDQSAKLSAALNNRASSQVTSSTSSETSLSVSVDSVSASVETQGLSLRLDSLSIAFVGTKLDVIDSGAAQVSRILGQLQSLASQASSAGLSTSALRVLNGQFQALRLSINNVPPDPPGSQYSANSLLEGLPASTSSTSATTSDTSDTSDDTVLGGFTDTAFLGEGDSTNLLTSDAAQQALSTISDALSAIAAQRSTISSLRDTIDFAAASVETAAQNQEAAKATLSADDLNATGGTTLQASLQAQSDTARIAQTSRLPNSILQLLAQ